MYEFIYYKSTVLMKVVKFKSINSIKNEVIDEDYKKEEN